jgi:hypothetical protein
MSVFRLGEGTIRRSAMLSDCGMYRYALTRHWGDFDGSTPNFIMLNPSVADSSIDDPTARRCVNYARSWGYAGLVITNLFALRSTDPRALRTAADPIGPDNDRHLVEQARPAPLVVCGWGNHGPLRGRAAAVLGLFRREGIALHCLRLSKDGHPCHPLYLPGDLKPIPFTTHF